MAGYWYPRYWQDRYWSLGYWTQDSRTGSIASTLDNFTGSFNASGNTGSYWANPYWAGQYWATNYWKTGTPGSATGAIAVTLENATGAFQGAYTWTEYIDLTVSVSLAWQITEFGVSTGTIAVTLASATSAATGVVLPPDSETGFINGRTDDVTAAFAGTHVAPAGNVGLISSTLGDATAALTGSFSLASVSNGTIAVTLAGVTSAFRGTSSIPVRTGSIAVTLDDFSCLIQGFSLSGYTNVGVIQLTLGDALANWLGTYLDPAIPPDPGTPITNPEAILYASQYEICDRTGFRVMRGTLIKQWDGAMVRPKSWEARHPQDFVRGVPEHQKGSPRPEQEDQFIEVEVSAEDL